MWQVYLNLIGTHCTVHVDTDLIRSWPDPFSLSALEGAGSQDYGTSTRDSCRQRPMAMFSALNSRKRNNVCFLHGTATRYMLGLGFNHFKDVIPTALNSGMAILQSLLYSCWKFRTPPTYNMEVVRVSHAVKNQPFYASLYSSTISGKDVATLSNIGFILSLEGPGQDKMAKILILRFPTWDQSHLDQYPMKPCTPNHIPHNTSSCL